MSGLLDVLQAASNSAAGTVSGPVDLINWLLKKAGAPTSDAPVGGSKWLEQKGLLRNVEPGAASVAGETFGLISPIAAAAKAPQIAKGLLQAGENYANAGMGPIMKQRGAIVYHGSPHKFDRFDSSKIGTGEGAQAYGHGIYVAESPGVADSYRANLSDNVFSIGGKDVLGPSTKYAQTATNPSRAALSMPEKMASYALDTAVKAKGADPAAAAIKHLEKYGKGNPDADAAIALVRQWKEQGARLEQGNLYKVDLPDTAIAKMLDWDSAAGQQQLRSLRTDLVTNKGAISEWARKNAPEAFNSPDAGIAAYLKEQGVPGVKYLDGGSRGAGAGSRNYVVFPGGEGLLKMLERNGAPLASP